jgi:hypothetical protein
MGTISTADGTGLLGLLVEVRPGEVYPKARSGIQ